MGLPLSIISSDLLEHLKTFTVFAVVIDLFSPWSVIALFPFYFIKKHEMERTVAERKRV